MGFLKRHALKGLVILLAISPIVAMESIGIDVRVATEVVRLLITERMSSEESQTTEDRKGEIRLESLPELDVPGPRTEFLFEPRQRLIA